MAHVHNKRKTLKRLDPTRSGLIRRAWEKETRNRFRKLKAALTHFLLTLDSLALAPRTAHILLFNARQRQFEFLTDADKLKAFNAWFQQQVEANVFSIEPGADVTKAWTAKYVELAYEKGLTNAYESAKLSGAFESEALAEQAQSTFLRSALNAPESVNKVRLLGTRSFEQLKGVTGQMAADMNRILSQGMIEGKTPSAMVKEMNAQIENISIGRAQKIVRTELVHAHAEGQLDAFEELGIEELGLEAEWSTAGDDRVCPQCDDLEGQVFDIDEARGMIPLHPNCRCTWIPHVPARR